MRRYAPIALLLLASCAATLFVQQQSTTLYFGTGKPDGSVVTRAEWDAFVRDQITPAFPGFTEWEAKGFWKGESETTHVVAIVHGYGKDAAIRTIIEEYKQRFAQEAVYFVRSEVFVPQ